MSDTDEDRPTDGVTVPAGHSILLYSSDEHRVASVASWTRDALRLGEKVILTGMKPASERAVITSLAHTGVDVEPALSSRQLFFAALGDFYPPDGQEAVVTAALGEGYPAVRMASAADAALAAMTPVEYADIEAAMDELCQRLPVSALCQYETGMAIANIVDSLASHPTVADQIGLVTTRPGRDGSAGVVVADIVGEFDKGNADVLHEALVRAVHRNGRVDRMELGLRDLRFLSVAAGRALLDGTAAFRAGGGTVLIRDADLHLTQVLTLLRVAEHAGIALEGMDP